MVVHATALATLNRDLLFYIDGQTSVILELSLFLAVVLTDVHRVPLPEASPRVERVAVGADRIVCRGSRRAAGEASFSSE